MTVLSVQDLSLALPGGTPIVAGASLELAAGELVALLGPSGAGKSTLLRAVLDPDAARDEGLQVTMAAHDIAVAHAFVPQRGALLDHLSVAGNIRLAGGDPGEWLAAVALDPELATRPVTTLSGGQAQRVALARALAAGRGLLILDEPSVGLDPLAVTQLATLLREQAEEQEVAILLITHDLALAQACHRVLFLDPRAQTLTTLERDAELADTVERRMAAAQTPAAAAGKRRSQRELFATLRTLGAALTRAFSPRLFGPSLRVLWLALVSALLRPLLFYAVVALLLGITVPYVVVHISAALRPAVLLEMTGGAYVLSLAPPLSAIVFAATSGSAVNAWLGGLGVRGQVTALEGLGVSPARYLWAPTWLALVIAYLVTALVFAAAMIAGGYLLFDHYAVPDALAKLTADFVDPPPERVPYRDRAGWTVLVYAVGVAAIAVTRGRLPKARMDQVTQAMTAGVMQATLLVVLVELGSIALLFAGGAP